MVWPSASMVIVVATGLLPVAGGKPPMVSMTLPSAGASVPDPGVPDPSGAGRGGDVALAGAVKGDGGDWPVVPEGWREWPAGAGVPDPGGLISGGGDEASAVGIE